MTEDNIPKRRWQSKKVFSSPLDDWGRKIALSPFNEKVFAAICNHASKNHYLDPLGRIAHVFHVEKVTLYKRFESDKLWNIDELRMIRRETKDPRIVDALIAYMNEEEEAQ